ncbi:MAG: serine/threonine protein kinase [Alphaproteobacteria bacterium]|nr:serine/threonine protein kinase [Alphaproteobacteria bacterium]
MTPEQPVGPRSPNTPRGGEGTDPLIGQSIAGRFLVRSLISRGSMGKVFLAEQQPLGRMVALKVLDVRVRGDHEDDAFDRRFVNEASALARLHHPNTVRIYDYGVWEGLTWLAMEYIQGDTLSALLRDGPLDPSRALRIATRVCASLNEAHAAGIIHRDLKPGNVLIRSTPSDGEEVVKVVDFGLVKDMEDGSDLTAAGLIMGSPLYMAPEQVKGLKVDPRADLYALGVMLYRMLTGVPPFQAAGTVGVLVAHVNTPPPPFSTHADAPALPPCVEWTVMRCLEKSPDDRFADATELKRALRACRLALEDPTLAMVSLELQDGRLVQLADLNETSQSSSTMFRALLRTHVQDEPERRGPGRAALLLVSVLLLAGVVAGALGVLLFARDQGVEAGKAAGEVAAPVTAPPPPEVGEASEAPVEPPSGPIEPAEAAPGAPEAAPAARPVRPPPVTAAPPKPAEPTAQAASAPAAPTDPPETAPPPAEAPAEDDFSIPTSDIVDPWSE